MIKRFCAAAALAAAATSGAARANDLEDAVLREYNFARTHPQDYAAALRAYRETFVGSVAHDPMAGPLGEETNEGVAAVDEAIAFMERQAPLPPLASSTMLSAAATILTTEQGPTGMIGHFTPAGINDKDRMVKVGGKRFIGEVISYGYADPARVVRQLIIDDGELRRGHRFVMFQPNLAFAGVSCGQHSRYNSMCAIDLAEQPDGGPTLPGARPFPPQTMASNGRPTAVIAVQSAPAPGTVVTASR